MLKKSQELTKHLNIKGQVIYGYAPHTINHFLKIKYPKGFIETELKPLDIKTNASSITTISNHKQFLLEIN